MKKIRVILYTAIGSFMLLASTVSAAGIDNPLGNTNTLNKVIDLVLLSVQYLGGVLSVIFIIIAGLKFVLANGDPKKIESARNMLWYVIIGIAILFGAKAISDIVQNTIQEVKSGI